MPDLCLPKLTLVIGGAASGKSVFAEKAVRGSGLAPVYIATAQARDDEMAARISRHRDRRGSAWRLVEAPVDLPAALAGVMPGSAVLVDCLTLWLTNLLLDDRDLDAAADALTGALATCAAPVVCVSNEVGHGIVPENALARRFRDVQGRLNQRVAARAELVVAVMAGLPLALKGALPE